MKLTSSEKEGILFDKCPVCKKGKVEKILTKFLFIPFRSNACNNCGSKFIERGDEEDGVAMWDKGQKTKNYKLQINNSDYENKYDGETLNYLEWKRGISNFDYCVQHNELPKLNLGNSEFSLPLQNGEVVHWVAQSKLGEERAIRNTTYTGTRIGRVYFGGSTGSSHGELRVTDAGGLFLTNKRIVFIGKFKNYSYELKKLGSLKEYSDAIELSRTDRIRIQTYFLKKPNVFSTFIKIAISKLK